MRGLGIKKNLREDIAPKTGNASRKWLWENVWYQRKEKDR